MHKTQMKILELAARKNINSMSLREIGKEVGAEHPQKVHYHITQLKKRGMLGHKLDKDVFRSLMHDILQTQESLLTIPVLGAANCGIATAIAEEMTQGSLRVSAKLIGYSATANLFAVRAVGNSLNKANIDGLSVENDDYLIVDTQKLPETGKYVLSIIDGCANIKKYKKEKDRIVLESESSDDFAPIFIHPDDSYLVNGVVVKVVKSSKGGE